MPIATTLQVVAPVPGNTLIGRRITAAFEPDPGGSVFRIRGMIANLQRNQEEPLKRRAPNANKKLVVDRTVPRGGANDVLTITTDEPKDANVLAQFLNQAEFHGGVRIWVEDPEDATDVASLMSNNFDATCYFGGAAQIEDNQFMQFPILIHADGIVTWDADADVSAS